MKHILPNYFSLHHNTCIILSEDGIKFEFHFGKRTLIEVNNKYLKILKLLMNFISFEGFYFF